MGIFRKKSIWCNHRGLLLRESIIRCAIFAKHCMGFSSPLGQGLASSMIKYWGLACIIDSQGSFWILTHIGPRGKYCRFSTTTTLSLWMMIREAFMSWKLTSINSFIPRIWENCDISRALRWHDPKMVLAYLRESMYWIFLRRLVCWGLDLLRQGGVYSSIFHIGRLFLELWSISNHIQDVVYFIKPVDTYVLRLSLISIGQEDHQTRDPLLDIVSS